MASKNEQKIQKIVNAMASKGIIASGGGTTITGNQIAITINSIPKRSSLDVTNNTQTLTIIARRGFFPGEVRHSIAKYTGSVTVTPSNNNTILHTGNAYNESNITVKGDVNLIPANIKSGVTIFGVAGTYAGTQSQIPYVSGSISIAQNTIVYLTEVIVGTSSMNVLTLSGINGHWNIPTHSILTLIWNNTSPPYYNNGLRMLNSSAQMSPRMFTFEVISNFTLQA